MTMPLVFYLNYNFLYFKFKVYFYPCNKATGGEYAVDTPIYDENGNRTGKTSSNYDENGNITSYFQNNITSQTTDEDGNEITTTETVGRYPDGHTDSYTTVNTSYPSEKKSISERTYANGDTETTENIIDDTGNPQKIVTIESGNRKTVTTYTDLDLDAGVFKHSSELVYDENGDIIERYQSEARFNDEGLYIGVARTPVDADGNPFGETTNTNIG